MIIIFDFEANMRYSTKQRAELIEFLKSNQDRCFSVKEIVSAGRLAMGEATVYRALAHFVSEGLVKKYVDGEGGGALYQYVGHGECESHFHLKCLTCGRLFHTDCSVIGDMVRHIEAEHDFHVDSVHTTIYGVCGDCSAKAKADAEANAASGAYTDTGADR